MTPAVRPRPVSDLAEAAPFIRAPVSVRRALRRVLVAAAPCLVMALYNTGYQMNAALDGESPPPGWRTATLRALGLGHSAESVLDCAVLGALFLVPVLAAVGLAGGLVERGFARARGRAPDHVALPVVTVLLALSLPPAVDPWKAAFAGAAGILLGKEIFGGLGRSMVSPVVVGLALLTFAYPGTLRGDDVWVALPDHLAPDPLAAAIRGGLDGLEEEDITWSAAALGRVPGALGQTSAAACGAGLLVLLAAGVASWRIVAGGVLGLAGGVLALQGLGAAAPIASLPWHWHLVTGSFAFGLVYLATDPVSSAATNPGRWIHGLVVGLFVAVVRVANPGYEDGVILALLLASVMAPLLDRVVGAAQIRWNRATRRG